MLVVFCVIDGTDAVWCSLLLLVQRFSFAVASGSTTANKICNAAECRNLIKKPWAFIRVPYMNPTFWVIGPAQGFLIRSLH